MIKKEKKRRRENERKMRTKENVKKRAMEKEGLVVKKVK